MTYFKKISPYRRIIFQIFLRLSRCYEKKLGIIKTPFLKYSYNSFAIANMYAVVGKLLLKSSWVTLLQLLVKVTRYF